MVIMKFTVKNLGISSGNISIVVLDDEDAFGLGSKPGDRIRIHELDSSGNPTGQFVVASVDLATGPGIVDKGEIGFYDEVRKKLHGGGMVMVELSSKPASFEYIKEKVRGKELKTREIQEIINDVARGNLLPVEIAAYIVGLEVHGATNKEVVKLTRAMAASGEVLDFGEDVYDKHSTGGVPGNKVSLLIVPICAAAGLFMPKTSTRAITSPSGTADSMEVLANVAFSKEKIMEILAAENAGIFWGGAIDSAPADNALIKIEKPLNMDPFPLMIASIACKKMAMGVKNLVLDIPCGTGTKFPTVHEGRKYATRFKEIARMIGIDTVCLLTSAHQPVGHAVGPALEAREAITLLRDFDAGPLSLRNKSCELAGILLEMSGKAPEGGGKDLAEEILRSGKAYEAMKRIIAAQGGDPGILPESIEVGPFVSEMRAKKTGIVTAVENKHINRIAKIAGCPAAKKSGIVIEAKVGAKVKEGEVIFRIFSDSRTRLQEAVEYYNAHPPQTFGGMTLERI
ncbi:AMP phosphorylase [Candidatus Bathyarchaeota archaeon]|nr:AMP phosphorylase [Candidatus Bathyarchaeota archaeon]